MFIYYNNHMTLCTTRLVVRYKLEGFLATVTLLAPMSRGARLQLVEVLQPVRFAAGEVIMQQGEKGACMYVR